MTATDLLVPVAAALIIALGVVVQVSTGSGFGMLTAPLLLLVQPAAVPAPLLLLTLLVMAVVARQERRALRGLDLREATVASVPGAVLGLWLSRSVDLAAVQLICGAAVLAGVGLAACGVVLRQSRPALVAAGGVGGLLGTLVAAPGPALVLVYRRDDAARYRANMALYFGATSAVALTVVAIDGGITGGVLRSTVELLPGLLLGAALAVPVIRRISPHTIKPVTLGLCVVSGTALVLRGLGG